MVDIRAVGRGATVLGLGGALATAGAAVGFGMERYVMGRALGGADPVANEPLGGLRGTPYAVEASDGVQLHVEVDGDHEPGLTVVFAHGFALNHDCWHFQRRDLRRTARLVFYDQRSHGRSGRAPQDETSVERLGRDLGEIVDVLVPPGPVVLVGHSMGGMSVMALAEQRPELFGERVVGVGLVATSAMLAAGEDIGLGARVAGIARRVGPPVLATASRQADIVESLRRTGSDLGYVLTKRYSFSRADIAPSLVEFVAARVSGPPGEVLSDFLPHLTTLDSRTALAALSEAHTLVIGAGGDRITPVQHSRDIVTEILDAGYLEVPDAGHMVMLEHPDLVTAHLRSLIARSTHDTTEAIDDPGVAPVPLPRPSKRRRRSRKQS